VRGPVRGAGADGVEAAVEDGEEEEETVVLGSDGADAVMVAAAADGDGG
jgi:hypothetical protein